MNATIKTAYLAENFPDLAPVRAKAQEHMNRAKGGAGILKNKIRSQIEAHGSLEYGFQVKKPSGGSALRSFAFSELAESAIHEITAQSVDPNAVNDILFGRYGLIHKSGGGRSDFLMEDIEVAFIRDLIAGTSVGPIITSGRHRTLALQILLEAAGIKGFRDVKVRCSVIELQNQDQVQERIISANVGSRDFSRAEIRERVGSTSGINLSSCDAIAATILSANRTDDFKAAFSSYLKLLASKTGLNHFTPAQYSEAGSSLWNALNKMRPENGTMIKWIKADKEGRFNKVMLVVEDHLSSAVNQAQHDPSHGSKSSKIAKALAPAVARRCF
tara:strand:- start:1263 stop:2252 length:990 start_codon:yes stop_codon:yes gene_type:complete